MLALGSPRWFRARPLLERQPDAQRRPGSTVLLAMRQGTERVRARHSMERAGLEVVTGDEASEVADLLRAGAPAALLIEARMWLAAPWLPDLLPEEPRPPVIVIGGARGSVDRALDRGATDVAPAPVDWRVLACRVARWTHAHSLALQLAGTRDLLARAEEAADAARARLQRIEVRDELTELPHREHFERLVSQALRALRPAERLAVIHLDVDRFAAVNDAIGRGRASEVLRQVAERLVYALRDGDLLAGRGAGTMTGAVGRLGGDDFTVLLTHVRDRAAAGRVGEAIRELLARPFCVGDQEVFVTASVGICTAPEDGMSAVGLLQRAETAMKSSRRHAGSGCSFYDDQLDHTARDFRTELFLHHALERGELQIHYQPLVACDTRRILAAEALLRWDHPALGSVSPATFVPIAERAGLMVSIGAWVIRESCRQLRAWIDAGHAPIRVAVNVSACQLVQGDLVGEVRAVLAETGLPPELLELELSERGVLQDEPRVMGQLRGLKALGVRLSVDDFGTGDSAIMYLKRFPLDVLKIDRSYIDGMTRNEDDAVITSAVVAMAHRLKLSVVAEGVESTEQVDTLRSLDCDLIQGFLVSRALPARELEAHWLTEEECHEGCDR